MQYLFAEKLDTEFLLLTLGRRRHPHKLKSSNLALAGFPERTHRHYKPKAL
jgi:hypothetical protein